MTTTQNLPNTPASPLPSGCFNTPPFLPPSGLPASPFLLSIRMAFEDGAKILLGLVLMSAFVGMLTGVILLLVNHTALGVGAVIGLVFGGAFVVRLARLYGYLT